LQVSIIQALINKSERHAKTYTLKTSAINTGHNGHAVKEVKGI